MFLGDISSGHVQTLRVVTGRLFQVEVLIRYGMQMPRHGNGSSAHQDPLQLLAQH
jgi:hypothetical protein